MLLTTLEQDYPLAVESLFFFPHLLDCLLAVCTLGYTLMDGGKMLLTSLQVDEKKADKYLQDRDFDKFMGIFKICYVAYTCLALGATFVTQQSRLPIAWAWMAVYVAKLIMLRTESAVRKKRGEAKHIKEDSGTAYILFMYMPLMGSYIFLKMFV